MKEIYVLNENGQPELISAGVERYEELQNVPIQTIFKGVLLASSTVSYDGEELVLTAAEGHKWSEQELILFCNYAPSGRYDVITESRSYELLTIDASNQASRKYRRSNVSSDEIWIETTAGDGTWKAVTDTNAEKLIVKFLNENEIPLSLVVGDPLNFRFYYYSTRGSATIRATITTPKGSDTYTIGVVAPGNEIDVNIGKYIVDGSNEISIQFENSAARETVAYKSINGVDASYEPAFNKYQAFKTNILFPYSCSSSSKKVVYFEITNAKGETQVLSNTHAYNSAADAFVNGNIELTSELFSHGINTISTYMVAVGKNGGQEYEMARTATYVYQIPYLTTLEPILMVYIDSWEGLKQYASLSVPYYIWSLEAGTADKINFTLSYSDNDEKILSSEHASSEPGAITNYLQFNTLHEWLISSLPASRLDEDSPERGVDFNIQATYKENPLPPYVQSQVKIEPQSGAMQPVENAKFSFNAIDYSQNYADGIWTSIGKTKKPLVFSNYNAEVDGLRSDEEGNQYVNLSSNTTARLSEASNPVFGAYDTPFTLEVSFKVNESTADQPIIKYYSESAPSNTTGLTIYPNKASIKLSGKAEPVDIFYSAGERIHLTYVGFHKTATDIDLDDNDTQVSSMLTYLFIYLNGILSKMVELDSSVGLPKEAGTIDFNVGNTGLNLYTFRGYDISLTSSQVLQNYISNFGNADAKVEMYTKNNLYDYKQATGVPGESAISFTETVGKIPCYVLVCDRLPRSKSYVDCLGIYYEKHGENLVEPGNYVKKLKQDLTGISKATTYYYYRETLYNEDGTPKLDENGDQMYGPWMRNKPIEVGGQGTSSMKYPRHNLKFKHNKNNKFYIKGHKDGPDRTFTFKADYMDSSGANNICNAQIMENALMRDKWIGTPIADTTKNLRLNLDGFPVAVFWCKSTDMKGGVKQVEGVEGVFDHKGKPLYDKVTVVTDNKNLGTVEPNNPIYIGTFNFNYDKKAKDLLGWNEDNFQGFEFRGNSSKCNLFKGFESFGNFASLTDGFEWRWTYCSDWVDDYYDGQLGKTINGGYVTEKDDDGNMKETNEVGYLFDRYASEDPEEYVYIEPYNKFSIEKDGKQLQLFIEESDGKYIPINYITIHPNNSTWNLTSSEGICNTNTDVCLEYGVKWGEKDGVLSFLYQQPYGLSGKFASEYKDRNDNVYHYYDFEWNPEHEFKFKLNTEHAKFIDKDGNEQDYYNDNQYWTALAPVSKIKAYSCEYVEDEAGEYVLDLGDGLYHLMTAYPASVDFNGTNDDGEPLFDSRRYRKVEQYLPVNGTEEIITWDFMKHIMKNWCYVNEAVAHCTTEAGAPNHYTKILDSRNETDSSSGVNNGNGVFIWDALTNYLAASITTGLCDNFAKNMFMHSYDEGKTWSPAWYDMDTCFGLDNQGNYAKPYDIDFTGLDDLGGLAFNGSDSKLWQLIYNHKTNQDDDFRKVYRDLRKNGKLGYNAIMDVVYDQNIAYKAEVLYNANAVYRYILPELWHDNNKPDAAQGNRLSLLKYWNKNRETYLDSLIEASAWTQDQISLRPNHTAPIYYTLTPSVNMYVGMNFNSGGELASEKSPEKVLAGKSYTIKSKDNVNNENTFIYGASHLWDVGDLSYANSTEYSLAQAINLRKIKIGDEVHPPKLKTTLGLSKTNPYNNLTEIDLTNVQFMESSRNLSLVLEKTENNVTTRYNLTPSLNNLLLKGSNLSGVSIYEYTPIKKLSLPDSLLSINLNSLLFINELELPQRFEEVEKLTITRCPTIDQLTFLNKVNIDKLTEIKLDNLYCDEEQALDLNTMDDLYKKDKCEISGDIYVSALDDSFLQKYREKWPSLTINLKRIFLNDAVLGIEGESTSQITRTYGALGLTNTFAYKDTFAVLNDFDSTFIGLSLITEDEVNYPGWIKINPFYTHYVTDASGKVIGREISEFEINKDYIMNPIFIDEKGNVGAIYISKYLEHDSNKKPIAQTVQAWHNQLQDLNATDILYRYTVETIWTRQLLQDLIAVEFARTDMSSIIPGSPKIAQTGNTDSLSYHTGIAAFQNGDLNVSFKYRGLEDVWRCGTGTYVQGIQNHNGWLYTTTNDYFPVSLDNWTQLNYRPNSGVRFVTGYTKELVEDKYAITIPSKTSANKTNTYIDEIYNDQNNDKIVYTSCGGGEYDTTHGLWSMNFVNTENTKLYGRLVRRYKDNSITSLEPEE